METPPKFGVLLYHAWNNRAPEATQYEVRDYGQLFGSHETLFEGLITDQHYQIALQNAALEFANAIPHGHTHGNYPEDIAENPPPFVVADAIHRCATAMLVLYWHPNEVPTDMNMGPFPMGTKVMWFDGRYWSGSGGNFGHVKDYEVVTSESELGGEKWTHGIPVGHVAYLIADEAKSEDPFWCDAKDLQPEGSY